MKVTLASIVIAIVVLACSTTWAGVPFGPAVSPQEFSLLCDGPETVFGITLHGAIYAEGDTVSALQKTCASLPEDQRYSIPEYVVAKEFEAVRSGKLDDVLANYHTEEDKAAAKENFGDIATAQEKWNSTVADIRFVTKVQIGPWVRIRYREVPKRAGTFAMPWAVILRKYEGRYYFVPRAEMVEFVHTVSETWPYWEVKAGTAIAGSKSLVEMEVPLPDSSESTSLKIHCRLDKFPSGTLVLGKSSGLTGRKAAAFDFVRQVVETYRSGNKEQELALWDGERRAVFAKDQDGFQQAADESKEFYTSIQDMRIDVMIASDDYVWVFVTPKYESGFGAPKLLTLRQQGGKMWLSDPGIFSGRPPENMAPSQVDKLLSSKELLQTLFSRQQ